MPQLAFHLFPLRDLLLKVAVGDSQFISGHGEMRKCPTRGDHAQKPDRADQEKNDAGANFDPRVEGFCSGLAHDEKAAFDALHRAEKLPDGVHQAQAVVALRGRDSLVGSSGLLILDGGGQLIELGFDEFAQPADRLFLLRIVDDELAEFVDRGSYRRRPAVVWNEVSLAVGQQVTALAGLRALHQR